MPIYEYSCRDCDARFETLVLNHDIEITCPTCKGGALDKLISAHAVSSGSSDTTECTPQACGTNRCPASC